MFDDICKHIKENGKCRYGGYCESNFHPCEAFEESE